LIAPTFQLTTQLSQPKLLPDTIFNIKHGSMTFCESYGSYLIFVISTVLFKAKLSLYGFIYVTPYYSCNTYNENCCYACIWGRNKLNWIELNYCTSYWNFFTKIKTAIQDKRWFCNSAMKYTNILIILRLQVYFYLFKLLRKSILQMSKPTVEGPLVSCEYSGCPCFT